MAAGAWCRSCGESAASADVSCRHCGIPLEEPDPGGARIGQVASVKGKMMLRRNGIALQEADGMVRVLLRGDETTEIPLAEFDAAKPVEVSGPPVTGAAGRLWKAQRALALDAKWDEELLTEAARAQATASTAARRTAALDALALGVPGQLPGLGLTATELAWYEAWAAAGRGDAAGALDGLERLPERGYEPRVALLLGLAGVLLSEPALGARAAVQLAPFTMASGDARALHAALTEQADAVAPLVPFAESAGDADGRLTAWASLITGEKPAALPFPDELPLSSALNGYLRLRAGADHGTAVSTLRWLPLPLLDELIDCGALAPRLAVQPGWDADRAAYVRCRLDPGGTGLPDLAEAGCTAELARRHYLAGDGAALDALPSEHEAVRHYRALLPWASESPKAGLNGLRPPAQLVLGQVLEAQAAVTTGGSAALSEELAADPTCWPLLWPSALQGALRLPGPLAGRYPRFAEWLALCGIQRLLFQSRWEDAIDAGSGLAARTGLEVTSDEALNMVAFAQHQLGQSASALQTLDDALGGRYTTGLLVNASIVAANQGSVAALPYLARIVREERDPPVRAGAVERAVALWQQDETSPLYPDGLRMLVRGALAEPQSDEMHRALVRIASTQDREWLAGGGGVRSVNPDQVAWERYQRAWARRDPDGSQDGLLGVARELAELVKSPSAPAWADQEMRKFIADLDEAVHIDFGDPAAVVLAPTIEALMNADALDPAYRIVFPVQAAAHAAVFLRTKGGCITPDDEQRMLFDPLRIYGRRWSEIPPDDREFVDSEILRCATRVAASVTDALMESKAALAERYNALVERQRHADQYELDRIASAKLKLLNDEYKPLQARLRRYHVMLGDLPLDASGSGLRNAIAQVLGEWGDEISGLGG